MNTSAVRETIDNFNIRKSLLRSKLIVGVFVFAVSIVSSAIIWLPFFGLPAFIGSLVGNVLGYMLVCSILSAGLGFPSWDFLSPLRKEPPAVLLPSSVIGRSYGIKIINNGSSESKLLEENASSSGFKANIEGECRDINIDTINGSYRISYIENGQLKTL